MRMISWYRSAAVSSVISEKRAEQFVEDVAHRLIADRVRVHVQVGDVGELLDSELIRRSAGTPEPTELDV